MSIKKKCCSFFVLIIPFVCHSEQRDSLLTAGLDIFNTGIFLKYNFSNPFGVRFGLGFYPGNRNRTSYQTKEENFLPHNLFYLEPGIYIYERFGKKMSSDFSVGLNLYHGLFSKKMMSSFYDFYWGEYYSNIEYHDIQVSGFSLAVSTEILLSRSWFIGVGQEIGYVIWYNPESEKKVMYLPGMGIILFSYAKDNRYTSMSFNLELSLIKKFTLSKYKKEQLNN